jgi:uncharacterized membrane protein HdeD (DUF308 family)
MSTDNRVLVPGGWRVANDAMSSLLAENWWAIALRGVFAIIFGLIALLMPGATLLGLVLLFAAYMLVDGILAIVASVRAAQRHERWGWLIVEGIVDLIAGAIAVIWPLITVIAFVWLLGAWAIVSGALLFVASFRLHITHGRWLMALGGAISVIWGILLMIWPLIGALVMTWWMAGYALFFGVALLVLAFRLRGRRGAVAPRGALREASKMQVIFHPTERLCEQRKLVAATGWAAHLLTITDNSAAGLRTAA